MYLSYDEIDFSKTQENFRSLILFDDVFLNMQAMNISVIDKFITEYEYSLLDEYLKTDRTPINTAMFVSAQSQMWIFAIYELLRTWRARIKKLCAWNENGGVEQMIKNLEKDELNFVALSKKRQLELLKNDPDFYLKLKKDLSRTNDLFTMIEAMRINLAKHEVHNKDKHSPRTVGYGRINNFCGALDFDIAHENGSFEYLNRRDISDAIRNISIGSKS